MPKQAFLLHLKPIARVYTLDRAIEAIAEMNEDASWKPTLKLLERVSGTLERKDPDEPIKHKPLSSNHTPLELLSSTTTPIEPPGTANLASSTTAALGIQTPLGLPPSTQELTPLLASLGCSSTQTPPGTRSPLGTQTPLCVLSSTAAALDPLPVSTTTTSATGKGWSSVTGEAAPGAQTPLGKQTPLGLLPLTQENNPLLGSAASAALNPLLSRETPLGTHVPVGLLSSTAAALGPLSSTQTPFGTQTPLDPLSSKETPLGKQSHRWLDRRRRNLPARSSIATPAIVANKRAGTPPVTRSSKRLKVVVSTPTTSSDLSAKMDDYDHMLPTAIVGNEYELLSSESPDQSLIQECNYCSATCLDVVKKKSFELPPLRDALPGSLSSDLSRILYPDEWEDSDDTANREKVLNAMQRHTEIVLPETYDQLVLNAELKAKHNTGQKTRNTHLTDKLAPEQAAKWKETCDRTWEEGVNAWDNAIATLTLIQGNVIIRSKDKRIVCIKLNGGVDLPWKQQRKGRMTSKSCLPSTHCSRLIALPSRPIAIEHFSQSFAALLAGWRDAPPAPGEFDHRHHAYKAMVEKYKNNGGAGVWHFALWKPYASEPFVSANCRGTIVYDTEAVSRFLSAMAPLQQAAANLFRIFLPDDHARYKQQFDRLRKIFKSMSFIQFSSKMAFLGLALLQNLRVLLHTDNADDKHGFVIMTPFGKFIGGHLLLGSWTIQYKMEYQPGDLVIFNSGILPHAITPYEGTRQAVVLFSHEGVFDFEL